MSKHHGKNKGSKNGSPRNKGGSSSRKSGGSVASKNGFRAEGGKNGSLTGSSAGAANVSNNGSSSSGDSGPRGRIMTVTFRIPASLKESVSKTARSRSMTTTRFVVEALENAVNNEPPQWWNKTRSGSGRSRTRARAS